MKIFGIGAHKTASKSIRTAMAILGYKIDIDTWAKKYIREAFYKGNYGPLFNTIESFDYCKDSPFNYADFYQKLFRRYPNSKFILSIRDSEAWFHSIRNWHENYVIPKNMIPANEYNKYWQLWYNVPLNRQNFSANIDKHRDLIIGSYLKRNVTIIKFFEDNNAKDRLLVIDIPNEVDPWGKLSSFLGKAKPDRPFPIENKVNYKSCKVDGSMMGSMGRDEMKTKIFIIGFNKTATRTLDQFFKENGLSTIHQDVILDKEIRTNINTNNILGKFGKLQVFSDSYELIKNYKKLDKQFPNSKFILNIRNVDSWILSRLNHFDGQYEYYNFYKKKFGLHYINSIEEMAKYWEKEFYTHVSDIKTYFKDRPNDLLIYDIDKDDLDKIITFLPEFTLKKPENTIHITNRRKGTKKWKYENKKLVYC